MTAPAIRLNDVHKSFGATQIIRGVSLTVPAGERHAIIGPNGAGKSTLFNLISGRLTPTSGAIELNGERRDRAGAVSRSTGAASRAASRSPTSFRGCRCGRTCAAPCCGRSATGTRSGAASTALPMCASGPSTFSREIDLIDRRRVQAGVLTYAEQRALEIGITIAGGADIILLDEPSAGMSVAEAAHAVTLIRRVSQGRTLIMIEHDMDVVFDLADRISVLVYGQIIASDVPASIKQDRAVQTAYLGTAA